MESLNIKLYTLFQLSWNTQCFALIFIPETKVTKTVGKKPLGNYFISNIFANIYHISHSCIVS